METLKWRILRRRFWFWWKSSLIWCSHWGVATQYLRMSATKVWCKISKEGKFCVSFLDFFYIELVAWTCVAEGNANVASKWQYSLNIYIVIWKLNYLFVTPCLFVLLLFRFVTPNHKSELCSTPRTPTPFKNALEKYGPLQPLVGPELWFFFLFFFLFLFFIENVCFS